jgi:hypothetical protein
VGFCAGGAEMLRTLVDWHLKIRSRLRRAGHADDQPD